jgi:hypothetical protein
VVELFGGGGAWGGGWVVGVRRWLVTHMVLGVEWTIEYPV